MLQSMEIGIQVATCSIKGMARVITSGPMVANTRAAGTKIGSMVKVSML